MKIYSLAPFMKIQKGNQMNGLFQCTISIAFR